MKGRQGGLGAFNRRKLSLIMKKKENRLVLIWSLLKSAFKWIQGGLMKAGGLTWNGTLHLSPNAFNGLVVGTLFSIANLTFSFSLIYHCCYSYFHYSFINPLFYFHQPEELTRRKKNANKKETDMSDYLKGIITVYVEIPRTLLMFCLISMPIWYFLELKIWKGKIFIVSLILSCETLCIYSLIEK